MKNRKVSRPAPVRPLIPQNKRLTERRREARDRCAFWLAVTVVTAAEGIGVLCLGRSFGDDILVTGAALLTATPFAMLGTLAAWNEVCETSRRLAKRERVLAIVQSRRLH